MNKQALIILFLFFTLTLFAQEKRFIKPNDSNIAIDGAFFLIKSDEKIIINRIKPEILNNPATYMHPANANTQSGVRISILTNSSTVSFIFENRNDASCWFSIAGIFKDGKLFKEIILNPKKEKELKPFTVSNPDGKKWARWTVVLPPFYGMNLKGIEIDKDSKLKSAAEKNKKPVYVAIGNSITHGTGQRAGYQTYPYIVAAKKRWNLYNVAVGGSKISWTVGEMLKNKPADFITILWGYNDWNAGFTTHNKIIPNYSKLLELLVKYHPDAKIYCILPTYSKTKTPKRGNLSFDDIKNAEKTVAEEFIKKGYNIKIIDGQKISDTTMLNDKVHFSINGAQKFAENLINKLN